MIWSWWIPGLHRAFVSTHKILRFINFHALYQSNQPIHILFTNENTKFAENPLMMHICSDMTTIRQNGGTSPNTLCIWVALKATSMHLQPLKLFSIHEFRFWIAFQFFLLSVRSQSKLQIIACMAWMFTFTIFVHICHQLLNDSYVFYVNISFSSPIPNWTIAKEIHLINFFFYKKQRKSSHL